MNQNHLQRSRRGVLRPGQVRGANNAAVLRLLRQGKSLSRAEISRGTGLSEGTISRITAGLLEKRLVAEEGAENSTGGRPGIRLRLDARHLVSMGVDILNWETQVAFGTIEGQILESVRFRTPASTTETLERIAEQFHGWRKASRQSVYGIGLTARGLVNSDSGTIEFGNAPGWTGVPAREELCRLVKVPVQIENDVRAAAFAEYELGGGDIHASRCLLFIKIGEGVGTGIVIDGRLHRGPHMAAGELGQMVVAGHAPGQQDTLHDNPGCIEALASNPAICDRYRRITGNRQRAASGDSTAQVKRICHLAMQGEKAAVQTIRETAHFLARGITNAVWLLDADVVVIDGALTDAWPLVQNEIQAQFPGSEFPNFRSLSLRPSSLAGQATMMAAVGLPFAGLFSTGEVAPEATQSQVEVQHVSR